MGTVPYMLTVTEMTGGFYQVKLHTKGQGEHFKGFFLQARKGSSYNEAFGMWKE